MGYTFRFFQAGGVDAVESEFGHGRAPALRARAELAAPTMVIGWDAVVITLLGSVAIAACRSIVV